MIGIIETYGFALARGAITTLWIFAVTVVVGTSVGVALAAIHRGPISRALITGVVHGVMAIPVLVIIVWVFYALPTLSPNLALGPEISAVLALSMSLSVFVADIVISGLQRIPRGEVEIANVMLGGSWKSLRYVTLPHALRTMAIPILGQYVTTLKFTTLASIIGVTEILHVGSNIISITYDPIPVYSTVALFFVILVTPFNVGTRRLERLLFPERRDARI